MDERRHDEEMRRALIADGEKLTAMTGEDHGPHPMDGPLTGVERLRLYAFMPDVFAFDSDDAAAAVAEIDAMPRATLWNKIDEVAPPQKVTLMVTGPSGYVTRREFLELAYIDEEYRPSRGGPLRWQSMQNDALSDWGNVPTHWAYPIAMPLT